MKKHFKNILLLMAAFVLLLHNTIPHQHKEQSTTVLTFECEGNHETLLGFFKMVLHQNTGAEHLEHLTKSEISDLSLISLQVLSVPLLDFVPLTLTENPSFNFDNSFSGDPIYIPDDQYISLPILRGPPHLA